MGNNYERLQNSHPCFGQKPNHAGRIHLPVCPGCNIACRFCDRTQNDVENRPGVTGQILTVDECEAVLHRALFFCPQLQVAGIAGPGDTLASDNAIRTFRMVKEKFPGLLKCMSTNGLLLSERAEELIELGIDSLTVTVNAVDPDILTGLNAYILYHGEKIEGRAGNVILIRNQLEGIRKVAAAGITVKVNTVLVPEVNGTHIEAIARTVSEAGATMYNIIPLIPQHELSDMAAPTCRQIEEARAVAGKYIDVFRHCQRCRADAVGVPGESEYREQVYRKSFRVRETFSHG